jgi:hypothetical protein
MRTGIPLVSPDDRWATVMKFKKSVSELAHQAATKVAIFEDNIKCVQSIVSLMSSILLDYACETPVHDYHKDNYNFVLELVILFSLCFPIAFLLRCSRLFFLT